MSEFRDLTGSDHFKALDISAQASAMEDWFDESIAAGNSTEMDRMAGIGLTLTFNQWEVEKDGDRKTNLMQQHNAFKYLHQVSEEQDPLKRTLGAQHFARVYDGLKTFEQDQAKENHDAREASSKILNNLPQNYSQNVEDADGSGVWGWLGAHGKAIAAEGLEAVEDIGGAIGTMVSGADSGGLGKQGIGGSREENPILPSALREKAVRDATEKLTKMGYNEEAIQKLVEDRRFEQKPFKEGEHLRVGNDGEIMFNPKSVIRKSQDEMTDLVNRLHTADSDPADVEADAEWIKGKWVSKTLTSQAAKERALGSSNPRGLSNIRNLGLEEFRGAVDYDDLVHEDRVDSWDGGDGEKTPIAEHAAIDNYLSSREDLPGSEKFAISSFNKTRQVAVGIVGGVGGALGARDFSKTMAGANEILSLQTGQLQEGAGSGFASDLVALIPDLLIARGGGTVGRHAAQKALLRAGKGTTAESFAVFKAAQVRAAGTKGKKFGVLNAAEKKVLAFEAKISRFGVGGAAGFSAGSRVVNEAMAQDIPWKDAVMLGFRQVLITGTVTYVGAHGGMERFATGAAFRNEARKFWKDYVGRDVLGEGLEEAIDELVSGIYVQRKMHPNMTNMEIADTALHAFLLGSVMGGTVNFKEPIRHTVMGAAKAWQSATATPETNAEVNKSLIFNRLGLGSPGAESVTPTTSPSDQPSKQSAMRTGTVPPRPSGEDGLVWDKKHGDDSPSGRTHNDDGSPRQVTVFEDVSRQVESELKDKSDDDILKALGTSLESDRAFAIRTLIDKGWEWNGKLGRFVNPSQPDVLPTFQTLVGEEDVALPQSKEGAEPGSREGAEPGSKSKPLERDDLRSLLDRATGKAQEEEEQGEVERVDRLDARHKELTSELNKLDENDKSGRRVIENELVDIENSLRRIAGEAEVDTSGVTPEVQAKSDAWVAGRVDEIQAKLDNEGPITNVDRKDWIFAGKNESDLPSPDQDVQDIAAPWPRPAGPARGERGEDEQFVPGETFEGSSKKGIPKKRPRGVIAESLASIKSWSKKASNKLVSKQVEKALNLGATIRYAKDPAQMEEEGILPPREDGLAGLPPHLRQKLSKPNVLAEAIWKPDGTLLIVIYELGLKSKPAELANTLIHETKHIGQFLYEETTKGEAEAKKAEEAFDSENEAFDPALDKMMRKEYPSWDNLNNRQKLWESTRAALEALERGETTNFRKGIFSYIKKFLNYARKLYKGDTEITNYLKGVEAIVGKATEDWDGPYLDPADVRPGDSVPGMGPARSKSPTPAHQAGPTPTTQTQPASTKPTVSGQVDIGEGVMIEVGEDAPSAAEQVFGVGLKDHLEVTGEVDVNQLSVKKSDRMRKGDKKKGGARRLYIKDPETGRESPTDRILNRKGVFVTESNSEATLKTRMFVGHKKASKPAPEEDGDTSNAVEDLIDSVTDPDQKKKLSEVLAGKGGEDLNRASKGRQVTLKEGVPGGGRVDPVTGNIEIDPNVPGATFRQRGLPRIIAEKAALDGTVRVEATTKALSKEVVDKVLGEQTDLTPDQKTRLFIAEALLGNKEAQAELFRIAKDTAVASEIRLILDGIHRGAKGTSARTNLDSLIGNMRESSDEKDIDLGSAITWTAPRSQPLRAADPVRVAKAVWKAVKRGSKNTSDTYHIDSGKGENEMPYDLAMNTIVEVQDSPNDPDTERWIVVEHQRKSDGSTRHKLRRIGDSDAEIEAEFNKLYKSPAIRDEMIRVLNEFRDAKPKNKASEELTREGMMKVIRQALENIVGPEYAESKLRFVTLKDMEEGSSLEGRPMMARGEFDENGKYRDVKIYVNIDAMWDFFLEHSSGVSLDGSNEVAVRGNAEDLSVLLNTLLFEEVIHEKALEGLDRAEVAAMIREMIKEAKSKGGWILAELKKWRAYQLGEPGADAKAKEKMWEDLLALNDKAEEDTDEGSKALEELNDQALMIGHEMLAGLTQLIKTGSTTTDVESYIRRFMGSSTMHPTSKVGGEPGTAEFFRKKTDKERFTTLRRLVEITTRMFESVGRYLRTHVMLNSLPEKTQVLVKQLDAIINNSAFGREVDEKTGEVIKPGEKVKPPDIFNIQSKALTKSQNDLDQTLRLASEFDDDLYEAQQKVREALRKLSVITGGTHGALVHLKWMPGNVAHLAIREDAKDSIEKGLSKNLGRKGERSHTQEAIDELNDALAVINASGRPTAIALNAADAAGVQLVMSRLGVGEQSGVVGVDDEEKQGLIGSAVAIAASDFGKALGLDSEEFLETLTSAYNAQVALARAQRVGELVQLESPDFSNTEHYGEAGARLAFLENRAADVSLDDGWVAISKDQSWHPNFGYEPSLAHHRARRIAGEELAAMKDEARGLRWLAQDGEYILDKWRAYREANPNASLEEQEDAWEDIIRPRDRKGFRAHRDPELVEDSGGPLYSQANLGAEIRNLFARQRAALLKIAQIHDDLPTREFNSFAKMLKDFESEQLKPSKFESIFVSSLKSDLFAQKFPGLTARTVVSAIRDAALLVDTTVALQEVESEMSFALLGGRPPRRVRQRNGVEDREDVFRSVNLKEDHPDSVSVPFNLAHIARTAIAKFNKAEGTEQANYDLINENALLERVDVQENKEIATKIARLAEIAEILAKPPQPAEGTRAGAHKRTEDDEGPSRQDLVSEIIKLGEDLEPFGMRVQFESGDGRKVGVTFTDALSFNNEIEGALLEDRETFIRVLGDTLVAGKRASYSMLMVDPTELSKNRSKVKGPTVRLQSRINAAIEADNLAHQLIERLAQGDSKLDEGVRITGGFPFEVQSEYVGLGPNGEDLTIDRPVARDNWFETPPFPSDLRAPGEGFDTKRDVISLINRGVMGEFLLEVASRLDAMQSESSISGKAVMAHEYGLTPAGFVQQLVANPFVAYLAELKGTTIRTIDKNRVTTDTPIPQLMIEAAEAPVEALEIRIGDLETKLAAARKASKDKYEDSQRNPILGEGATGIEVSPAEDTLEGELQEQQDELARVLVQVGRIRALFSGLAPGLENNSLIKESQNVDSAYWGYIDLGRQVGAANLAYRATMDALSGRQIDYDIDRASKLSNDNVEGAGLTLGFNHSLAQTIQHDWGIFAEERRRHSAKDTKDILSIIRPGRPGELIELFHKYSPRSIQNRIMEATPGGKQYILDELADKRHNLRGRTVENSEENSIERELQKEQDGHNLMANLRTLALMQIYGGNLEGVKRVLRSYATVTPGLDGSTHSDFNWGQMDSDILDELHALLESDSVMGGVDIYDENSKSSVVKGGNAESLTRGTVDKRLEKMIEEIGWDEPTTSKRPDFEGMSQRELEGWGSELGIKTNFGKGAPVPPSTPAAPITSEDQIREDLSKAWEARPSDEPTLNHEGKALTAVLQSQGSVLLNFLPDDNRAEKIVGITPRHHATAWTVMTHLAGNVPGLRFIKGKASELSKEDVPSLAFIGTEDDPVIIMPFRYQNSVSQEDIERVTKELIVYISNRNNTNIREVAMGLLQPLVDVHEGRVKVRTQNEIESHMRTWAVREEDEGGRGRDLSPNEVAQVRAAGQAVWGQAEQLLNKELGEMRPGSGGVGAHIWGNPALARENILMAIESDESAADVIATFINSEPLKRILGIASIGLDVRVDEDHYLWKTLGTSMRADLGVTVSGESLPRWIGERASEGPLNMSENQMANEILDGWAQSYQTAVEVETISGAQEVDETTGEATGSSDLAGFDLLGVHQTLPAGFENGDDLLMNALIELSSNFEVEPTGIQPSGYRSRGLTDFEARQMLALFSSEEISEIASQLETPITISGLTQTFSIPELKSWTEKAANVLRDYFDEVKNSHDEETEYDIFSRWGTSTGIDYLHGGTARMQKIRGKRLDSGRYSVASLLGIEEDREVDELLRSGGRDLFLDASKYDADTLRARLIEVGLSETIPNREAGVMRTLDDFRTQVLEENPDLSGDALIDAIVAKLPEHGSVDVDNIGPVSMGAVSVKRLLRDFDYLEDVDNIDIVSEAVRAMEDELEHNIARVEEQRRLVRDNTARAASLDEALSQLNKIREHGKGAKSAPDFWRLVHGSKSWDALSKDPRARATIQQTVKAFFSGPDDVMDALADHMIRSEEESMQGVQDIPLGTMSGESSVAETTVPMERGYRGTDERGPATEVEETTLRGETHSLPGTGKRVVHISDLVTESGTALFKAKQRRVLDQMAMFEHVTTLKPEKAPEFLKNLLAKHARLTSGRDNPSRNQEVEKIETLAVELAKGLNTWVIKTTEVVDKEFGEGVLGRVTELRQHPLIEKFPESFIALKQRSDGGRFESQLSGFIRSAKSVTEPKALINRIQAHALSQSIQAFVSSPTHQASARPGDFSGQVTSESVSAELMGTLAESGLELDAVTLDEILNSSRGRPDRKEYILEELEKEMKADIDKLFSIMHSDIHNEAAKLKQRYIRGGEDSDIASIMDEMDNLPLLEGLTPAESKEAYMNGLEKALALDRAVTQAELTEIAETERGDLIKNRPWGDQISTFRDENRKLVRIKGSPQQIELTQRVLTKIGQTHRDDYERNLKGRAVKGLENLDKIREATTLADEQLLMKNLFIKNLEDETGEKHSIVRGLLVPADIDQRIEAIIARRKGAKTVDPKTIKFGRKQLEAYAAWGRSVSDYDDFTGAELTVKKGEVPSSHKAYDEGVVEVARGVMRHFVDQGAATYAKPTTGQAKAGAKAFGGDLRDAGQKARIKALLAIDEADLTAEEAKELSALNKLSGSSRGDLMKAAESLPVDLISYLIKFGDWVNDKNTASSLFAGDSKEVVTAFNALKESVNSYLGYIGATKLRDHAALLAAHKKALAAHRESGSGVAPRGPEAPELPQVTPDQFAQLLGLYNKAKALTMGRLHGDALEAGFVDLDRMAEATGVGGLWGAGLEQLRHTDAKIRHSWARTLEGQSMAQDVIALQEYGLFVGGGSGLGRQGAKSMLRDVRDYLMKHAPKRFKFARDVRRGVKPDDKKFYESLDFEMAGEGYLGQWIISQLDTDTVMADGRRRVTVRAQEVLKMFRATDTSYAKTDTKEFRGKVLSEDAIRDRRIYEAMRDRFRPILQEIVTDRVSSATAVERIKAEMDTEAQRYGQSLSDLFGYLRVVYQAQAQLMPNSEYIGVDPNDGKHSWIENGNAHILPSNVKYSKGGEEIYGGQAIVPMQWTTVNLEDQSVEKTIPSLSDQVSMRGGTVLRSMNAALAEANKKGSDQVININGLTGPAGLIDDMLYRMNMSASWGLIEEFTGVSEVTSLGGEIGRINFRDEDKAGFFGTFYSGRDEAGSTGEKTKETRMRDIGLGLSRLAQEILVNDTRRRAPGRKLEKFVENTSIVGMSAALTAIKQLISQVLPGTTGYASIYGEGNGGVWSILRTVVTGQLAYAGPLPGLVKAKDKIGFFNKSRQLSTGMQEFIKKQMPGLYERTAEGIVATRSALASSRPRAYNSDVRFGGTRLKGVSRALVNTASAAGRGAVKTVVVPSSKALQLTVAEAEKIALTAIAMNEIMKRVQEVVDRENKATHRKVTLEDVINGKFDSYLHTSILDKTREVVVDIMAQADEAKKGKAFQRKDKVFGGLMRGAVVTFGNHLISTAVNTDAALRMWKHGKGIKEWEVQVERDKGNMAERLLRRVSKKRRKDFDESGQGIVYDKAGMPKTVRTKKRLMRKKAARLAGTNLAQNLLYHYMNLAIVSETTSKVLIPALNALLGDRWDDEEEEEVRLTAIRYLYGLEDGTAERYGNLRGWVSRYGFGSKRPHGFDYSEDDWTDEESQRDWTMLGVKTATEVFNQAPGVGPLASTTLGGEFSNFIFHHTIANGLLSLKTYGGKQAGVRLGNMEDELKSPWDAETKTELMSDLFKKGVYMASYGYNNYASDRNYFFMGLNHMAQPLYRGSSMEEDITIATAMKLAAASIPAIPREARSELRGEDGIRLPGTETVLGGAGASPWHKGPWGKKAGSGKMVYPSL